MGPAIDTLGENWNLLVARHLRQPGKFHDLWKKTNLIWVALCLADLTVQATRRADMSSQNLNLLSKILFITLSTCTHADFVQVIWNSTLPLPLISKFVFGSLPNFPIGEDLYTKGGMLLTSFWP